MERLQENLDSVQKMNSFYQNNKKQIDSVLQQCVIFDGYFKPALYAGMLNWENKPHSLTSSKVYLDNYRKIFEVFEKYKNRDEVKTIRETYPIAESMLAGFFFIESRLQNREGLLTSSASKGIAQIQQQFKSAYPDLSGRVADFTKIPTNTNFGMEPETSVYNTWSSIERMIAFIYRKTPEFKKIAAGIPRNDRKYPVAGWFLYLNWNQGPAGAKAVYDIYRNAPDTLIRDVVDVKNLRLKRNLTQNPMGGKRGEGTVGDWVERLRKQYNIGQYIACNNCIARAFKSEIESNGSVVVGDAIQRTNNITCPPLKESDYAIKIGSLIQS